MPLPIIAAVIGRAVLQQAIKAGVRVAATRAAQRAAIKAAQRTIRKGVEAGKKRLQKEIARRKNCKNCKDLDELVSPCSVLSKGVPGSGASHKGGSHGANRRRSRSGVESHHMPADSAYPTKVSTSKMPAIQMDKADHMKTASWGSSKAAQQYQRQQRNLIAKGKLREAFMLDVLDIRSKFGSKYDAAIAEAAAYMECVNKYKDKYGLPAGGRKTRKRR